MHYLLIFCALITLFVSPLSYAETSESSTNIAGYFSKQHPLKTASLKAALTNATNSAMVSPTDIIVNNATFNPIFVTVVEGGFTDVVNYRGYDHIFNGRGAFDTRIMIADANHVAYFNQVVCPRASITVYGYTPYDVVVDTESCKR